MPEFLREVPGRLFLVATLLPLFAFAVLLAAGTVRRFRSPLPGYFASFLLAVAASCSVIGLSWFLQDAESLRDQSKAMAARWGERVEWLHLGGWKADARPARSIDLGYRIDHLTALMVTMVTVVGTLIFLFSLGYMKDEQAEVEDHHAHVRRRGRFGRFYLYLSLFAFSMLNILIADNLFQIFVGWELVGVSSFFLIGFYTERRSASTAANKAFIVNRVGDAGLLVALAVAWFHVGSFNLDELFAKAAHLPADAILLLGLGIFCGCAGKSAQVPLHTWLPDAMEGPTPVSALIHAATMVAAGVYLVGRCWVLFTPDVLLVIAYLGAATMILSALVAVVQTDIKRVLAYSTCSQLGFMMLALGLGAWTAALLHLLTHAFFKALLFLGAGSVIHGLHHEQDLSKMGGLRRKMPVTAYTMFVGVLAIAGMPLLSGWYSKELILSHVIGSAAADGVARPLLTFLPFLTAGLTSYYMFRLWFLAFAGEPRDRHLFEHAHESPAVMTLPLLVLAAFSVGVAWGWPVWSVESSQLAKVLHHAQPPVLDVKYHAIHGKAEEHHLLTTALALGVAAFGFAVAIARHRAGTLLTPPRPAVLAQVLRKKFYFDELYAAAFTQPTVELAKLSAAADKRPDVRPFNLRSLDGVLNAIADSLVALGTVVRRLQTGQLRTYILALGLTLAAGLGILLRLSR
ncbi:NADH-quinone oxidoreductase subunit L [Limnoglobus roseus]|uniref:NADH-quinone oxidoreductase subunit L n=1 Tax=Limnoglobus roseus TaxID=2598579 RepID=A0A5C1AIT7_9BACT|nr:NADH-quinone oxidoreductase subunit L [Limnoglobus roseus]QEL17034.1 NADH-quinone oxidoreductase subunit L [Limnoglobus roseus]